MNTYIDCILKFLYVNRLIKYFDHFSIAEGGEIPDSYDSLFFDLNPRLSAKDFGIPFFADEKPFDP